MPLIPCPDCGREISAAAPACPHCGRPMAPPAASHPKPVAGIAAVLVIGGISLVRALFPRPLHSTNPDMADYRSLADGVQVLGNSVAIIGAFMAMMGHRAGNRVVRAASAVMIPITLGLLALAWPILGNIPSAQSPEGHRAMIMLMAVLFVVGILPWLLFLFLFRRSKHG
jgi:hypothetical protein